MIRTAKLPVLLLTLTLTVGACGGEVAEEAYDGDAPPPPSAPGLEGAATTGPSIPVSPDSAAR